MANWFTRGINRINDAAKNLLGSIGGEQPTPAEEVEEQEYIAPPPEEEEYEDEYEEPYEQPIQPPPEEPPLGGGWDYGTEPTYRLYGDGAHAGEHWDKTGPEWIGEAYLSNYELIELYGLDNLDVLEQLIDEGYDYDYISEITGEVISGVWHDWREIYGETA